MIINSIELKNFGIHVNKTFEFTLGINAIVGRNGTGKSSIINAIGIGLFNAVANLSDFVTYGRDTAKVIINFRINNQDYTITREFGKSSFCSLIYDNREIKGVKDVYSFLADVFGIDLKAYYLNVLRIKSSSITYPFIVESSKKKIIFDDILGISEYNSIWESLREPIKILENNINDRKNQLEFQRGRMDYLRRIREELKLIDLSSLEEEYNVYLDNKSSLERRSLLKDKSHKANLEMNNLLNEAGKLDKQLLLLKDNICFVCLQPIEDSRDLIKQKEETIKDISTRVKELRNYIDSLNKEINLINIPNINESSYSNLIRAREKKRILEDTILSLESESDLMNQLSNVINDLTIKKEKLSKIRDGFRLIPQLLSKRHTKHISFLASQILSSLMDKDIKVIFDTQYESKIEFDNNILNFNQLSDGQQVLASLAIRLSIIKIFNDLGISILDEPTINLDATSRQLLVENLKTIGFNQLFVVSHSDEFEAYVDNLIYL